MSRQCVVGAGLPGRAALLLCLAAYHPFNGTYVDRRPAYHLTGAETSAQSGSLLVLYRSLAIGPTLGFGGVSMYLHSVLLEVYISLIFSAAVSMSAHQQEPVMSQHVIYLYNIPLIHRLIAHLTSVPSLQPWHPQPKARL